MLTQYQLTLNPDRPCRPRPEWGYRLYAALLAEGPGEFGGSVHQDGVTPVSQFFTSDEQKLRWTVNLLGSQSEEALSGLLAQAQQFRLEKDGLTLEVAERRVETIRDVDELFRRAALYNGNHSLRFHTATAFKSQGQYLNLPTSRLIVQSLIKKWNGCITDCPIEDVDGQGMEALAAGLRCERFSLRDWTYYLKGRPIPGFVGELRLDNRLEGFHRQLADALLLFADFSGVGIKTALGMGGVEHWNLQER